VEFPEAPLTAEELSAFLDYDTCKVANAIESLRIRLRNEGFTAPGLRCVTGGFPGIIGYAVTSRVRCADPPWQGTAPHELVGWWEVLQTRPLPHVVVIEDVDEEPGRGAVLSNLHAEVLRALGCVGVVTNGAVRNIGLLAEMRFPAFACHVTMSHAYVHMVEYGQPVEILGLPIAPSDLIYADTHGMLSIPVKHARDILRVTRGRVSRESQIIDFCRSNAFNFEELRRRIRILE
jgi:regulator of RNase E activity RraA